MTPMGRHAARQPGQVTVADAVVEASSAQALCRYEPDPATGEPVAVYATPIPSGVKVTPRGAPSRLSPGVWLLERAIRKGCQVCHSRDDLICGRAVIMRNPLSPLLMWLGLSWKFVACPDHSHVVIKNGFDRLQRGCR